ncbi:MAG: N-acetyltransferase [Chitinophagaceae bacterium]|nr:N-acetyltransferase [Chitinophagaceae bacterium]
MINIPETANWVDNKEAHQFEWWIDGYLAKVEYRHMRQGGIALTHTETAPELEGNGVAGKLVKSLLEYFKAEQIQIWPYCPYVYAYLQRHPEYKSLVHPDFSIQ